MQRIIRWAVFVSLIVNLVVIPVMARQPVDAPPGQAGGHGQALSRDGAPPEEARPRGRPVVDGHPSSAGRAPTPPTPGGGVSRWPWGGIQAAAAYAHDVYPGYTLNYLPDLAAPGAWSIIAGGEPDFFAAGDFINGDFTTQYVLNYWTDEFLRIDTATGARTFISYAYPSGYYDTWSGMTGAGSTLYVSSADCGYSSSLYTINPTTGALTWIGTDYNVPCLIDIAYNPADGMIYGVDLVYDELVRINPATGLGVVVGWTGIDANYAQGMDLDEATGILYWAAYNYTTGQGELRTVNMGTGMSTLVGAFAGGAEVDAFSIAAAVPPAPNLSTSYKQATPKVEEGGLVQYTVAIVNAGQVTGTGVTMVDPVPASAYQGDLACSGGRNGTYGYDAGNQRVWWNGDVGMRNGGNLLSDPGFENGPPPASAWTEWVDPNIIVFGCPEWIVDPTTPWGIPAHTGAYTFWTAGYCDDGYSSLPNSDYVQQSVAIPAGCNAQLSYLANYYRPDLDDPPDADWFYLEASTDGGGSWNRFYQREYLQEHDSYPYWIEQGPFDLSAYNGTTTLLRIGGASGPGQYTGNALVDDVLLRCGPARVDRVTCTYTARAEASCGDTVTNQATISAPGMDDVVVTASTEVVGKLYYFSDFEADSGGFSTTPPEWEWGVSNMEGVGAHSGQKAWGVDLDADYENNAYYALARTVDASTVPAMSPCADPALWLQWWEWYSTEPGWDYVYVYVNGALVHSGSGSSGGWVHRQVDISSHLGGPVNIQFLFTSDSVYRDYPGWYIDDVAVHLDCYGVDMHETAGPVACHQQPHGIWLGSDVDDEICCNCDPEDDGLAIDPTTSWYPGQTAAITVTVGGGAGFVKVWFDFNRNGVFEAEEEAVDPPAAVGENRYTFVVPAGFDPTLGDVASRVRLYTADPGVSAPPGGTVVGGEVEDSVIVPTAVRLVRFAAAPAAGGVLLTWETVSEENNVGFHLYRSGSLDGPGVRLNEALIPARNPGGSQGARYTFLDETAAVGTAYYWLEDVDLGGVRTRHGPAVAGLWRAYLPVVRLARRFSAALYEPSPLRGCSPRSAAP